MDNSDMCYWHHKARLRDETRDKLAGPLASHANTGIEVPLLEDGNAIQIGLQEVINALLDRRIDEKRAGLILYALQLAGSNLDRVDPQPSTYERRMLGVPYEDWQEEQDEFDRKHNRKVHVLPAANNVTQSEDNDEQSPEASAVAVPAADAPASEQPETPAAADSSDGCVSISRPRIDFPPPLDPVETVTLAIYDPVAAENG